ncbi:MAG: hypothetical protein JRE18_12280 [Deltaproteobacteria bacterium]|jgi:hypothetical protein|nr:hypothetical protein [Deltaproteobacteria bacterium]
MHAYNNVALTRKTDKASNLIVKENFLNIFVSQGKCDKGGLGKNSPKNQLKNINYFFQKMFLVNKRV